MKNLPFYQKIKPDCGTEKSNLIWSGNVDIYRKNGVLSLAVVEAINRGSDILEFLNSLDDKECENLLEILFTLPHKRVIFSGKNYWLEITGYNPFRERGIIYGRLLDFTVKKRLYHDRSFAGYRENVMFCAEMELMDNHKKIFLFNLPQKVVLEMLDKSLFTEIGENKSSNYIYIEGLLINEEVNDRFEISSFVFLPDSEYGEFKPYEYLTGVDDLKPFLQKKYDTIVDPVKYFRDMR